MSLVIIGIWLGILALLVKFGVLKKWTLWMKLSPLGIEGIYFIIVVMPMNFEAPKGAAVVFREFVQISPGVPGHVTEVPVISGAPINAGDVLFKIDPAPYQAAVDGLDAQLQLSRTRLEQAQELARDQAGSVYEVQQYDAQTRQLEAQLKSAQHHLHETTVRAPSDGFVPHIALNTGTQVNPQQPVMTFIDTSKVFIGGQIPQNYARHIRPDQKAEVVLKLFPGKVFTAKVNKVLAATPAGQLSPTGLAMDASVIAEQSFVVVLELPEDSDLQDLPAGSFGTLAVYTKGGSGSMGELVRAVTLRIETWKNLF